MEDFYDTWDNPTPDIFGTTSDSLYATTVLKKIRPRNQQHHHRRNAPTRSRTYHT